MMQERVEVLNEVHEDGCVTACSQSGFKVDATVMRRAFVLKQQGIKQTTVLSVDHNLRSTVFRTEASKLFNVEQEYAGYL